MPKLGISTRAQGPLKSGKSRTGSLSLGCLFDKGRGDFRKINPGKEFQYDPKLNRGKPGEVDVLYAFFWSPVARPVIEND
jgi:hypothetical protein